MLFLIDEYDHYLRLNIQLIYLILQHPSIDEQLYKVD
ncbi:Uncharacterised protein [Chlamydia trachomatis]|nr:Uncharacterised protein [Chlamydia trachomatis]